MNTLKDMDSYTDVAPKKHSYVKPPIINKRAQSATPLNRSSDKKENRRASSLSPTGLAKANVGSLHYPSRLRQTSEPSTVRPNLPMPTLTTTTHGYDNDSGITDMEPQLPHATIMKMQRNLATKKREFIKLKKTVLTQQKVMLELYTAVRELEIRLGNNNNTEQLGEVRVVSVTSWPPHDLLLLVRDDIKYNIHTEIGGIFGPQILQQLHAQLNPITEDVLAICAELMARRIDVVNLVRGKQRNERPYSNNHEWKTKNTELDNETERLHKLVAGTMENLRAKINYALDLAKMPWLDRDSLVKKVDRIQKENMMLQHKLEDKMNNVDDSVKVVDTTDDTMNQKLKEELDKERAEREALKEVVGAAEGMLRVARTRITTLERQLKESKNELEAAQRKYKDLEQLCRSRENTFDARSKKLLEVSKTSEMTIEALSRQRDALEIRVKELREELAAAEKIAENREAEQRAKAESLQSKVLDQEKRKLDAEVRVAELENKVKELEDTIINLRERSGMLVDMERKRCLDYLPSKENEPSDRETDIWKELQLTRGALTRAEEELRQSRTDKENFLYALSKIAQEGSETIQEKMANELLAKEQKITKLQNILEEQRENEKLMEQTMTQYEDQLANLRLEVKRLRNYDCYSKVVPYQDLQTELMELNMRVDSLTRERSALVTAAATRALMLERHERSADLFARVTRARRELTALLEGRSEPSLMSDIPLSELARSLSSMCVRSAETWTALRAERARVLRLESAMLAQSLQLEREGRVRTQLERRRALLERQVLHPDNYGHSSGRTSTTGQAGSSKRRP